MTFEMSVFVQGVEYSLTSGVYCYYQGDDGLGEAPAHRLSIRSPEQHGDTDRGFRLDPRHFRLMLEVEGPTWADMWSMRYALENILGSRSNPVKFRWVIDSTIREIEAFYVGGMNGPSSERRGFSQVYIPEFKASDPSFYNPVAKAVTFSLGGGSGAGEVPSVIPMLIGVSTLDVTNVVNYDGNWISFPTLIRITGPITDAIITNQLTSEILDFTGTTISGGDYYDIDLRYGSKTVVDSGGTNRVDKLSDDSDLVSWHLEPNPGASGAAWANSIRVQGTSITESTKVEITYLDRHRSLG